MQPRTVYTDYTFPVIFTLFEITLRKGGNVQVCYRQITGCTEYTTKSVGSSTASLSARDST